MMISKMADTDLEKVLKLEAECFKQPWNQEQCLYELHDNPFSTGYILVDNQRIVGYAFLWITFELAQLARIGVDPSCRQKGYGTYMMKFLMETAHSAGCEFMSLEVRASNLAAQTLYTHAGFLEVNRSKSYYPDGEDAVVMTAAV